MAYDSPTYTYELSIPASGEQIVDFSDKTQALRDRPFNFVRVISDQQIEVYLDGEKYFIEANTINPIEMGDRVFYTIKVKNKSTTDTANVKLEVQRIGKKTEILAGKLLGLLNRIGV